MKALTVHSTCIYDIAFEYIFSRETKYLKKDFFRGDSIFTECWTKTGLLDAISSL